MTLLSLAIATNVRRLREQRKWSQKDLCVVLDRIGSDWDRQKLSMLESKGIRAERLPDLVSFCLAFQVPLSELIEVDDKLESKGGWSLGSDDVLSALSSGRLSSADAALPPETLIGADDPSEARKLADRLGWSADQLRARTLETTGQESPTAFRDFLGGLSNDMDPNEIRARRGHGTRIFLNFIIKHDDSGSPTDYFQKFSDWQKEVRRHGHD